MAINVLIALSYFTFRLHSKPSLLSNIGLSHLLKMFFFSVNNLLGELCFRTNAISLNCGFGTLILF